MAMGLCKKPGSTLGLQAGFAMWALWKNLPFDLQMQLAVVSMRDALGTAAMNKQKFLRQRELVNPSTRLLNDSRLKVCNEKHGFTD